MDQLCWLETKRQLRRDFSAKSNQHKTLCIVYLFANRVRLCRVSCTSNKWRNWQMKHTPQTLRHCLSRQSINCIIPYSDSFVYVYAPQTMRDVRARGLRVNDCSAARVYILSESAFAICEVLVCYCVAHFLEHFAVVEFVRLSTKLYATVTECRWAQVIAKICKLRCSLNRCLLSALPLCNETVDYLFLWIHRKFVYIGERFQIRWNRPPYSTDSKKAVLVRTHAKTHTPPMHVH